MTEILLLEIYTNIAINPHGTRCFLSLPLSCSLYFVFLHFLYIFLFLWHLLQLCLPTAFYSTDYVEISLSRLFRTMHVVVMGCVCQPSIKKLLTYLFCCFH